MRHAVADLVERRNLFAGEAAGLGKDRVDDVLAEFAERSSGRVPARPAMCFKVNAISPTGA